MIIGLSLIVFAITLTVTKATILHSKREFVQKRYESAKVGNEKPSYLHWFWHAMWTCPMCLGFWVSIFVCAFYSTEYGYIGTVLIVYGLNWIWHCIEEYFFVVAKYSSQNMKLVDRS